MKAEDMIGKWFRDDVHGYYRYIYIHAIDDICPGTYNSLCIPNWGETFIDTRPKWSPEHLEGLTQIDRNSTELLDLAKRLAAHGIHVDGLEVEG